MLATAKVKGGLLCAEVPCMELPEIKFGAPSGAKALLNP